MNKIKNFTFGHYTFMGFYNASEWKTAWDLEKNLCGDYVHNHFTSA